MRPKIKARYTALRAKVLSVENIHALIDAQMNTVSGDRRLQDRDIWGTNGGNGARILKDWVVNRMRTMDVYWMMG